MNSGDPVALREAGALASSTAQVLTADVTASGAGAELVRTARLLDRAGREPSQRPLPVTPASHAG